MTGADGNATFQNKWGVYGHVAYNQLVDTRALFGGPALRSSDFWVASAKLSSDNSRKVSGGLRYEHDFTLEGDTRAHDFALDTSIRPSGRLTFSATAEYLRLEDDLQYVGTVETTDGTRWMLGRNNEHLWNFTFRINLAITPDLTLTYYGSPFIASSRFTNIRKATETLSPVYENRFHRYGPDEIAYSEAGNEYLIDEAGRPSFSLPNPDFSVRRVPLEPRRALGVQAGLRPLRRLAAGPQQPRGVRERLVPRQLDDAVEHPPRQRVPGQAELLVFALGTGQISTLGVLSRVEI